jgi:hypothetical protein
MFGAGHCHVIISDEGMRGGKSITTKAIIDAVLKECPLVVVERVGVEHAPNYCPPKIIFSENFLFILYERPPPPNLHLLDHQHIRRLSPYHRRVPPLTCPHRQPSASTALHGRHQQDHRPHLHYLQALHQTRLPHAIILLINRAIKRD